MGIEIERKFSVQDDTSFMAKASSVCDIKQGYLTKDAKHVVRVRTSVHITAVPRVLKAYITIKGKTIGCSRPEYEYEIPYDDAKELLSLCSPIILKLRYTLHYDGKVWEVDEFHGRNSGLVVAEIELSSENEHFALPPWVKEEVTSDPKYYNVNLAQNPYDCW